MLSAHEQALQLQHAIEDQASRAARDATVAKRELTTGLCAQEDATQVKLKAQISTGAKCREAADLTLVADAAGLLHTVRVETAFLNDRRQSAGGAVRAPPRSRSPGSVRCRHCQSVHLLWWSGGCGMPGDGGSTDWQ